MLQNLNTLTVDWIQGISVTITGVVVVFGMLVLLVFILFLFGKVFDKSPKAPKVEKPKAPAVKKVSNPTPQVSVPAANTNDEIIAVIAAAVASMYEGTNVKPVIRRINKSGAASRPAWTAAGIFENTRAF